MDPGSGSGIRVSRPDPDPNFSKYPDPTGSETLLHSGPNSYPEHLDAAHLNRFPNSINKKQMGESNHSTMKQMKLLSAFFLLGRSVKAKFN